MPQSQLSNDEQLQEKLKHERALKLAQRELKDVLNLNDEIMHENKEKDLILAKKEQQLQDLQQKNVQDIDQLKMHRSCVMETIDYDIDILKHSLKKMEMHSSRYVELLAENESLQKSLEIVQAQMSKAGKTQAVQLHEMNKHMRVLREQMESTFRRELINMDMSYQRQAFNELEDHKKKSLFANCKLKDELALLGVGISNLGVRLSRERTDYSNTRSEIHRLSHRAKQLRETLVELRSKIMTSKSKFHGMEAEVKHLAEQREFLMQKVHEWPQIEAIEKCITSSTKQLAFELSQLEMWTARREQLEAVRIGLKPVTSANFHDAVEKSRRKSMIPTPASLGMTGTKTKLRHPAQLSKQPSLSKNSSSSSSLLSKKNLKRQSSNSSGIHKLGRGASLNNTSWNAGYGNGTTTEAIDVLEEMRGIDEDANEFHDGLIVNDNSNILIVHQDTNNNNSNKRPEEIGSNEDSPDMLLDNTPYSHLNTDRVSFDDVNNDNNAIHHHHQLTSTTSTSQQSIGVTEIKEEDIQLRPIKSLFEIMRVDHSLDLALRPLVGMEGSLLLSFGEVNQHTNVMAWIVTELLEIWKSTDENRLKSEKYMLSVVTTGNLTHNQISGFDSRQSSRVASPHQNNQLMIMDSSRYNYDAVGNYSPHGRVSSNNNNIRQTRVGQLADDDQENHYNPLPITDFNEALQIDTKVSSGGNPLPRATSSSELSELSDLNWSFNSRKPEPLSEIDSRPSSPSKPTNLIMKSPNYSETLSRRYSVSQPSLVNSMAISEGSEEREDIKIKNGHDPVDRDKLVFSPSEVARASKATIEYLQSPPFSASPHPSRQPSRKASTSMNRPQFSPPQSRGRVVDIDLVDLIKTDDQIISQSWLSKKVPRLLVPFSDPTLPMIPNQLSSIEKIRQGYPMPPLMKASNAMKSGKIPGIDIHPSSSSNIHAIDDTSSPKDINESNRLGTFRKRKPTRRGSALSQSAPNLTTVSPRHTIEKHRGGRAVSNNTISSNNLSSTVKHSLAKPNLVYKASNDPLSPLAKASGRIKLDGLATTTSPNSAGGI